ncbi:MAG TPA: tRNA (guanosine(46)-N7)-methyltransferase TrmB [Candidatus Intestinimonas stercoravium]|nr:tRNA (guanosine(46)-N7)-methyltransferase TrmB [Candidatus Intestinimonas stercoravium]
MRMRKKPNLIPRMERCSRYLVDDPAEWRGRWREKLAPGCALRLELGCGKGRFTCETAAAEPDVLFVAVERVPDAMIIAMERAQAAGLRNVFFIDADVAKLREYFAPGEVERIYLNFSDPWPANRHAKRRLTHPGFLEIYRDVLQDGGEIHFKTDNKGLFEWSLFQFPKADYALTEVTRDLHRDGVQGVMTDYEEKFHAQGVKIHRCVAVKLHREPEEAPEAPGAPVSDGDGD